MSYECTAFAGEGPMGAVLETKVYKVSELASHGAKKFGLAIGRKPSAARKKIDSFARAIIDPMKIGEEERFPIPSAGGQTRKLVVKKLAKDRFSLGIIE